MREREVESIRRRIDAAGGLVNGADLARVWGLSRERIRQLVELEDFPEPIGHPGIRPVWLREQCEDWRERWRADRASRQPARSHS